MENCGASPDFGDFTDDDPYQWIEDLMPYPKGISAKTFTFNEAGDEMKTDYRKALKIVLAHAYHSWLGIEFEGQGDDFEGIRKSKELLEKLRSEFS